MHLAGIAFWSRAYLEALGWVIRARRPLLALAISPYLIRGLMRRFLFPPRSKLHASRFQELEIPESIIPYDRICSRGWRGRQIFAGSLCRDR
jgi:hypothetical protein